MNAYELAEKLDEYNADGCPVLIVDQAATMLRQQAEKINNMEQWEKRYLDRIDDLEKQVKHYKNKTEYLDKRELEFLAEITSLEKDLHMVQRHYDQLDTQLHPKESRGEV